MLFQLVSWPGLTVDSSGDIDVACHVLEGELTLFLMWTLLVTQTVACPVSVGELAWFLMSTILVTQMLLVLF